MAEFRYLGDDGAEGPIVNAWLIGMITGWLKSETRDVPEQVSALIEEGYIIPNGDGLIVDTCSETLTGDVSQWLVVVGPRTVYVLNDSVFGRTYISVDKSEKRE